MTNFEVNIKTLITNKIGFEAYFVLYCLYRNDKDLMSSYVINCKKINTEVFNQLSEQGYIVNGSQSKEIYFESLYLTKSGKQIFNNLEVEKLFEEFKKVYPSKTPMGRRLHNDLKRCKTLYSKLLEETDHDTLCRCAKLYYEEKQRIGIEYIQGMDVWLNQRNYQQYIEDIGSSGKETTFTDDI